MSLYTAPAPNRIRANREALAHLLRTAVAATALACASAAPVEAQPSDGSADPSGSYQYLSQDAKNLVNGFLNENSMSRGARSYNSLTESQRATFEAIVHALYAKGIFAVVDEVTGIWGENQQSDDGRDQFRVSVKLAEGAADFLWEHRDYKQSRSGHVKMPGGYVEEDRADSVRQRGRRPGLQISWREDDDTTGEIDIDYRGFFEGHLNPANSDVRDSVGGEPHIQRHLTRYETPPGLMPWWRTQ